MDSSSSAPQVPSTSASLSTEDHHIALHSSGDGTSWLRLKARKRFPKVPIFCSPFRHFSSHMLRQMLKFRAALSSREQYHNFKAIVNGLQSESEESQQEVLDSLLQVLLLPSTLYNAKYWKLLFEVYTLIPAAKTPSSDKIDLAHQLAHQGFNPHSAPLWVRYLSKVEQDAEKHISALEALVSVPFLPYSLYRQTFAHAELNSPSDQTKTGSSHSSRLDALDKRVTSLYDRNEADSNKWQEILSDLKAVFDSYPIPTVSSSGSEAKLGRLHYGNIRIEVSEDSIQATSKVLALRQRAVELWQSRMDKNSEKHVRALGLDAGLYILHRALGEAFDRRYLVLARHLALNLIPALSSSYRELSSMKRSEADESLLDVHMVAKMMIDLRIVLESELAPCETHSEDNALIVALMMSECYGQDFGSVEASHQAAAAARGSIFEFMSAVSSVARALPSPDIVRYVVHLGLLSAPPAESNEQQITDGDFFIGLCLQEWHQAFQNARAASPQGNHNDLISEFLRVYEVHLDFHIGLIQKSSVAISTAPSASNDSSTPSSGDFNATQRHLSRVRTSLERLAELVGTISSTAEILPFAAQLGKKIVSELESSIQLTKDEVRVQELWKKLVEATAPLCLSSSSSSSSSNVAVPSTAKSTETASESLPTSNSSPATSTAAASLNNTDSTLNNTDTLINTTEGEVNLKKRGRDETLPSTEEDLSSLEPASKIAKTEENGTIEDKSEEKAAKAPAQPGSEPPKFVVWAPRPPHQPGLPQHDDSFRLSAALVNALIPSQRALTDVSGEQKKEESKPSVPVASTLDTSTELERLEEAQRQLLLKKKKPMETASEIKYSAFLQTSLNATQRAKLSQLLQKDELFGLVKQLEESQSKAEMELEREKTVLQSMHAQRRVDLTKQHQARSHGSLITSDAHLQTVVNQNAQELKQLETELALEMAAFEAKRSDILAEKLRNQQQVLHAFGVPGFTATKDEQAIKIQRAILELIVTQAAQRPKPPSLFSSINGKAKSGGSSTSPTPSTSSGTGASSSAPGGVAITYESADARQSMLQHHLELLKAQHSASSRSQQARLPAVTSPVRPMRTYPYTAAGYQHIPFPANAAAPHPPPYAGYAPHQAPRLPIQTQVPPPYQPLQHQQPYGTPSDYANSTIDAQLARLDQLKQRIVAKQNQHGPPAAAPPPYGSYYSPTSSSASSAPSQAEVLQDLNRQLAAVDQRDRYAQPHPSIAQHSNPPASNPYYPPPQQQTQASNYLRTNQTSSPYPTAAPSAPVPQQSSYYPYAPPQATYQQPYAAPARAPYYPPPQATAPGPYPYPSASAPPTAPFGSTPQYPYNPQVPPAYPPQNTQYPPPQYQQPQPSYPPHAPYQHRYPPHY